MVSDSRDITMELLNATSAIYWSMMTISVLAVRHVRVGDAPVLMVVAL